ncbi:TrmH family RNA methyltransferase [Pasteuria penetrans]|uniref:TrmH family RNA methyltransferase n=1 Tax=Pasteuria penetrans TaxID=86005 RepID=UPI000F94B0EF|nr:RNA methyltransferase [Pasteuria penetrans]
MTKIRKIHKVIPLTSLHSTRFRVWRQLKSRKGRQMHRAFLLEGPKLIAEALQDFPQLTILVTSSMDPAFLGQIPDSAQLYQITETMMRRLSDTITPQNCLAVLPLPDWNPENFLIPCFSSALAFCLLLDGVQDPGNMGTILRTAGALGVTAVVFGKGTADPFQTKVVRAAQSAVWRLPVLEMEMEKAVVILQNHNVPVWTATVGCGESVDRVIWPARVALIVGSEARGISSTLTAMADKNVTIPMGGGMDSLNVAIAAALCMAARTWGMARQRKS